MAWAASTARVPILMRVARARIWWSTRIPSRSSSFRPTMRVWRQNFAHRRRRRRFSKTTYTHPRRHCTMCRFTRCSARDRPPTAMAMVLLCPVVQLPLLLPLPLQTAWTWNRTRLRPPVPVPPTRPATRCRRFSRRSCRRARASFHRSRRSRRSRRCSSCERLRIGRRAPILMPRRLINPVRARRRLYRPCRRRLRPRPRRRRLLPLPLLLLLPRRPPR
jgi:hypothetical protein